VIMPALPIDVCQQWLTFVALMSFGTELESFIGMAEPTARLLRLHHDFHIAQTICDQVTCRILVFEIPAGMLLYSNAAAKAYLVDLYLASCANQLLEDVHLARFLPMEHWRAWLKDAEIADRTGKPVQSGEPHQLCNVQTIPIYPRVVARCIMPPGDILADDAARVKSICADDQA
jgi:hypothetical protein